MAEKSPWTVQKLIASTAKFAGWRKDGYSSAKTRELVSITPYAGTGAVIFQFFCQSITGGINHKDVKHQISLWFSGLDVILVPKEAEKAGLYEGRGSVTHIKVKFKGKVYWVEKPDIAKTSFRCKCTCPDHYFRFGWWNYLQKAHWGPKPRPYKRKTPPPPIGRPPVNPKHIAGMCKHCTSCLQLMQTKEWTQAKTKRGLFKKQADTLPAVKKLLKNISGVKSASSLKEALASRLKRGLGNGK